MMIAIAILCSIVASLGISLYFHNVNKAEDPLNKFGRYADKREESLLKLYNEIKEKFQIIVSDFNAQQTQASAAIKLLKQQNEDFSTKIQTFDQNIKAVQSIKTQLDQYSQIIGDLNEMTDQVEENLERIHKESGIVDKLSNRLNKQQQIVENIERKIPEVSKSFSDHNAEQLKAIGTQLLSQYETYANNVTLQIQTAQKDAEDALSSIKNNIQQVYNEASVRADKLENTAFTHLSEKAQERADNYLQQLNDQTADLQNALQSTFATLTQDMQNRSSELQSAFEQKTKETTTSYENSENALLDDAKKHLALINEKFTDKLNTVAQNFTEKLDTLQKKYTEKCGTLSNQFESEYQTFKASYDQTYQNISSENADKLTLMQKECDENIAALQSAFGNKFTELNSLKETIFALQNEISASLKKVASEASTSVEQTETSVLEIQKQCEIANQKAATLVPELDEKIQIANAKLQSFQEESNAKLEIFKNDSNAKLDSFQTQTNSKLENLEKIITDSVRKAVSESEVKHLNILEDVDSQLSSYKKDIEYKLSQIQISETDIDTLEKSLKAAMNEVQNRILHDFDSFTMAQKQKHEEFSKNIKEDSNALESKINEMNENLDDLKATATGSMSQKLQEFESEFNQTLSTKNNQIDTELSQWKHELDSRLTTISNTYEDSRREVESKYLDEMKSNFESLQSRQSEQNAKLTVSIEQTKQEMQDSIADIRDVITKFKSDTGNSISSMTQNAEMELKREIEKNVENIQTNLSRSQEKLLRDLQDFEEAIRSKQETGTSTIDAALAEFTSWKKQFKIQLDDSTTLFNTELESYKTTSRSKLDEVANNLMNDMNNYASTIQMQHNELNTQIAELQNKTQTSIEQYETRSNEILTQLNSMYEQMLTATEQKVREQNADASLKVESLKKDIQDATAQNQASQSNLIMKMQDDANSIQIHISELAKELQEVKSNIAVYEKAEKMKTQIEDQIMELSSSFGRLDSFAETANKMNAEYNSIIKINEDLDRQLTSFESQKTKVMNLEQQFARLISLSGTIDDRIMSLNTTKDDLQSMEVTVRNYNDRLQFVSEQYERLEKKDEVVSRIMADVDIQFDKLKELEQRLIDCNRQTVSLPQEIREVQSNVDKILQNGPKITTAIGKLENLESLITETENKIDTLNSVQNGLKKTELDLQTMSRDIDSKFNVLNQITKQDLASKPAAKNQTLTPQINESVRQLKHQGWTNAEIADKLKLSEIEVDLILQLPE